MSLQNLGIYGWKENVQTINCYDEAGISKGLKKIAVELGYELPEKIKIEDLRKLLVQHPGFCPVKKLTKLISISFLVLISSHRCKHPE